MKGGLAMNRVAVLRSVLFLPGSNPRAIAKARALPADAVVFDLEDAVAPDAKADARLAVAAAVREGGYGDRALVVRVNALDTPDCPVDLAALAGLPLAAVIAPKVRGPEDVRRLSAAMDVAGLAKTCALWAMVETAAAALDLAGLAVAGGRLGGLVLGLNDLAKETGIVQAPGREVFAPLFLQAVLAARANGLVVFDGVCNALDDSARLEAEVRQARAFGFDGKTVIHPAQIGPVNAAFAPSEGDVDHARAVVAAFADPANAGLGALRVRGQMVEALHRDQALALLARAEVIARRAAAEKSPT